MSDDKIEELLSPKPKTPPQLVKNGEISPDYPTFDAKDKIKRLRIHRFEGAAHAPAYSYLLDVSYNDKEWTDFVLTYSFMQVRVKGKNLQSVIIAIENNACAAIRESDVTRADIKPDEPIIEKIEIVEAGGS